MGRRRQSGGSGDREDGSPQPSFTHCVACNYESAVDFDVCPSCKAQGMSVLVIRRA